MKTVIRRQYTAKIKGGISKEVQQEAFLQFQKKAEALKESGVILTAALCRYQNSLFLYLEYIVEEGCSAIPHADELLPDTGDIFMVWPGIFADHRWAKMYPVFWSDEPKSLETWKRKVEPDARCGRIAVVFPDKLFSYVCHHQALVQEGLLVGDRYQFISQLDDVLFSYFETPRDREQVNIRRSKEPSREIEAWMAVDPDSHFRRFVEGQKENFPVIETVFAL